MSCADGLHINRNSCGRRKEYQRKRKKRRRQKIRKTLASIRDAEKIADDSNHLDPLVIEEDEEELKTLTLQQEEANRQWLERERIAQEEWAKKVCKEEMLEKVKQVQEKLLSISKENLQSKAGMSQAKTLDAQHLEDELQVKCGFCSTESWLEQLNSYLESEVDDIPGTLQSVLPPESENLVKPCRFYTITGACRFATTCTYYHLQPKISKVILIPNFYNHFGLGKAFRDEFNSDMNLEFEDADIYSHFREFYDDVIGELRSFGTLVQFKVCSNFQPHLRGNVYVQFNSTKEAVRTYLNLQGRSYDGRQLACHFVTIPSWKSAICGLYTRGRCRQNMSCNFLHVFRDPYGLFREADRDWENGTSRQPSPSAVLLRAGTSKRRRLECLPPSTDIKESTSNKKHRKHVARCQATKARRS